MDPITIVGIVVASILGGILLFMLGKLTINAVRKIRKNAQAKAAIIDMKSFIAQAVKNPNATKISWSDLDHIEALVAEIDENNDVKNVKAYNEVDEETERLLDVTDDGIVLVGD